MRDYINEAWQALLRRNGLDGFEKIWGLDAQWFEEPNRRRNGWSGVARCELSLPDGGKRAFFLKRQEDHNTFSWLHPIAGIPTFLREFRHIMRYRGYRVPTLEPVYFAYRKADGHSRAILITEELSGFVSLDELVRRWQPGDPASRGARRTTLQSVARLLYAMHKHGIQHNCFFPKHVFVRIADDGTAEARVIDLEKSRWRPLTVLCALRDLDTLNRYAQGWSLTDRLRFLIAYLGIPHMTPFAKWLWRHLARRAARKNKARKAAA